MFGRRSRPEIRPVLLPLDATEARGREDAVEGRQPLPAESFESEEFRMAYLRGYSWVQLHEDIESGIHLMPASGSYEVMMPWIMCSG